MVGYSHKDKKRIRKTTGNDGAPHTPRGPWKNPRNRKEEKNAQPNDPLKPSEGRGGGRKWKGGRWCYCISTLLWIAQAEKWVGGGPAS